MHVFEITLLDSLVDWLPPSGAESVDSARRCGVCTTARPDSSGNSDTPSHRRRFRESARREPTLAMRFGFASCPDCGASLVVGALLEHTCDRTQLVDFQVARARFDIDRIDSELAHYLETAHGRFEVWYAERSRTPAAY
jgi:hypothetical protein